MPAPRKTRYAEGSRAGGRAPQPVTDEMRADVIRLHGEGLGRNEIARQVGVAGATVTKLAREAGLVFSPLSTELAVAVEKANVAAIRAEVSRLFIIRSREALADMDAPTLHGSFGGRDGVWREVVLDSPPADVKRNLMTIAAIGAQRHAELERFDAGEVEVAGASVLDALGGALTQAAETLRAQGMETPEVQDM